MAKRVSSVMRVYDLEVLTAPDGGELVPLDVADNGLVVGYNARDSMPFAFGKKYTAVSVPANLPARVAAIEAAAVDPKGNYIAGNITYDRFDDSNPAGVIEEPFLQHKHTSTLLPWTGEEAAGAAVRDLNSRRQAVGCAVFSPTTVRPTGLIWDEQSKVVEATSVVPSELEIGILNCMTISEAGVILAESSKGYCLLSPGRRGLYKVDFLDLRIVPNEANDKGQVAGQANGVAATWSKAGGIKYLGNLAGGTTSSASGINSSGTMVGWADVHQQRRAFVFAKKTTDLNLVLKKPDPRVLLESAVAVSDSGNIVCSGKYGGRSVAFRLSPSK